MPLARHQCRVWVWVGNVLLLALAAFAAPTFGADSAATTVFEGQLLSVPGRGPVLRLRNKDYPLAAKTTYLFHTLEDKRLEKREVRLEGTLKRDGTLEVARLYTVHNGKLFRVRYYCDVCNIVALEPGPCVCCQRPTELQEIPVSETDQDTVAN
jgi:hypothetical protein